LPHSSPPSPFSLFNTNDPYSPTVLISHPPNDWTDEAVKMEYVAWLMQLSKWHRPLDIELCLMSASRTPLCLFQPQDSGEICIRFTCITNRSHRSSSYALDRGRAVDFHRSRATKMRNRERKGNWLWLRCECGIHRLQAVIATNSRQLQLLISCKSRSILILSVPSRFSRRLFSGSIVFSSHLLWTFLSNSK
jgi:hypothetical protein